MSDPRPTNLTAFAAANVRGNSPLTQPESDIANSFPGLAIDSKNLFVDLFVGLKVDAFYPIVLSVQDPNLVTRVPPGTEITQINGDNVERAGWFHNIANKYGLDPNDSSLGAEVVLTFGNGQTHQTRFNKLVEDGVPVHAQVGQLTQSLCSPWTHDFKECGCFYWAASRPDLVVNEDGVTGQDWIRTFDNQDQADTYKDSDPVTDPRPPEVPYRQMYHEWERLGIVRKKTIDVGGGNQQMLPVEENRQKDP